MAPLWFLGVRHVAAELLHCAAGAQWPHGGPRLLAGALWGSQQLAHRAPVFDVHYELGLLFIASLNFHEKCQLYKLYHTLQLDWSPSFDPYASDFKEEAKKLFCVAATYVCLGSIVLFLLYVQVFHEIPGKRWDALTHLPESPAEYSRMNSHLFVSARLDSLGVSDHAVRMAEVGVEAANRFVIPAFCP